MLQEQLQVVYKYFPENHRESAYGVFSISLANGDVELEVVAEEDHLCRTSAKELNEMRDAINEMRKANGEPSLTEEELPTATEDEEWDSEWCRCDFLFASGDWLNYHKENDEVLLCIEPDFVFELYPQMDLREDPKYTYVQPGYEIQDIYVEWKIYFWHGGLTDNYLTITLGREDIARLRDYLKLVIKR